MCMAKDSTLKEGSWSIWNTYIYGSDKFVWYLAYVLSRVSHLYGFSLSWTLLCLKDLMNLKWSCYIDHIYILLLSGLGSGMLDKIWCINKCLTTYHIYMAFFHYGFYYVLRDMMNLKTSYYMYHILWLVSHMCSGVLD